MQRFGNCLAKWRRLFGGNGISWNGYEHNALLMNEDGHGFVNVGFLMNVSFEFDSRAALSGDIDGDGRVDLIVENKDLRASESKLYIVRNVWDQGGHWIGVHLRQSAGHASPLGARVTATLADGRILLQHNVAGHSVWVQHANTMHFGLGDVAERSTLDVHWPDGTTSSICTAGGRSVPRAHLGRRRPTSRVTSTGECQQRVVRGRPPQATSRQCSTRPVAFWQA